MLFGACQEGRMDAPLSSDQELPQARTLPNTPPPKPVRLLHTHRQIFGAKERDLLCVGWCPTALFLKISLIIFILEFYLTPVVQGTNPFSLCTYREILLCGNRGRGKEWQSAYPHSNKGGQIPECLDSRKSPKILTMLVTANNKPKEKCK